ncbi:MAG: hypothetical protein J0H98_08660 [Solirubrobacterales bacterium]|nr:hypothetical protein [Solirubrobacterales bacterium]
MPQRMDAGTQGGGEVAVGCAVALVGAVALGGSLFLDRADDYFYDVAGNRLIEFGAVGPALVVLVVAAIGLCLLGFVGRLQRLATPLLLLVSLACLALTIYAATDIGVHPTDMGDQSNDIAIGSVMAIASSVLMAGGGLVAFGGAGRNASINSPS